MATCPEFPQPLRLTLIMLTILHLGPLARAQRVLPVQKTPWGEIRFDSSALELRIRNPGLDGTVKIPRLHNPVRAVYRRGDPTKASLKLSPGTHEWSIALPNGAQVEEEPLALVLETVGEPRVAGSEPPIVSAAQSGVVMLPAHEAITYGERLRYEPQSHKDTIGYWSQREDWCEWKFEAPRSGKYLVDLLQGCGNGQGGSEAALSIGRQELSFIVEDTGHFQNFKRRSLGMVELQAGETYPVRLRAKTKAGAAVMDVREVRLTPLR